MFRGCTFKDQPVDGANDGGFYQEIFSKDGILWGCEMTVTNTALTIQPGELIISGRVIRVDGASQIPFTGPIQNGYGQVVLTIDLSKTATKEEFDQVEASVVYSTTSLFPELTQGEINTSNGDMVYQQELAVVSIAGGNITGITRQIGGAEIDAERLGGQLPEYYAKKSDIQPRGIKPITNIAGGQIDAGGTCYVWTDGQNTFVKFFIVCREPTDAIGSGAMVANISGIEGISPPQRQVFGSCVARKAASSWYGAYYNLGTNGVISITPGGDGGPAYGVIGEIVYPNKF